MMIEDRMSALHQRHATLEAELREEMRRPIPNAMEVQRLKRRKLRVKDQMQILEGLYRTLRADGDRPTAA